MRKVYDAGEKKGEKEKEHIDGNNGQFPVVLILC